MDSKVIKWEWQIIIIFKYRDNNFKRKELLGEITKGIMKIMVIMEIVRGNNNLEEITRDLTRIKEVKVNFKAGEEEN